MNTPDIPSPTELASIADDLEKQTESVNQLEFLVTILDKLTELDPKANETASNFKWKLEFHPSDLRFLSEAFSTLADGLEYHDMESDADWSITIWSRTAFWNPSSISVRCSH